MEKAEIEKKQTEPEYEIDTRRLDKYVLAVAKQGGGGFDWAAYIGSTHGLPHDMRKSKVLSDGTKLPYSVAKVLFPHFDEKYSWRY